LRIYLFHLERKKDCVLNIIFLIMFAPTISLINIEALFLSLMPQKFLSQFKKSWEGNIDSSNERGDECIRNSTWEIVHKSKNKKVIGCRWIFTVKHKADRSIDMYKPRLVAKGCTQTYGIDYKETFSAVAKMNTIQVVFALAVYFGWDLHRLNVKNIFLHGALEEVYWEILFGFETQSGKNKVCLLKKILYIKQSPKAWYGRFTKAMASL